MEKEELLSDLPKAGRFEEQFQVSFGFSESRWFWSPDKAVILYAWKV